MATTQQELYSNLRILTKTKYSIIIEKKKNCQKEFNLIAS